MSMMTELSFLGEVFPQNAKRVCTYVPFLSVFPSVHRAESSYSAYHWIYQELLKCIWKSSICQQDVKKMCNCANNSYFFFYFPSTNDAKWIIGRNPQSLYFIGSSLRG